LIKRFKVFLVPENKVSITVTYKPYDDVTRPIFCGGSWWWSYSMCAPYAGIKKLKTVGHMTAKS
jgi:hypothetical protein